jgi:ubiquinone biosynthesis protein COQ4
MAASSVSDTTAADRFAYRPAEAWKGLRALLRNPEETEHVFTIVRALSGKSLLRGYNRFSATPTGRVVLDERRELLAPLRDRDYLRSLPEGSLGRHYLAFVEQEDLTADGLVEASQREDLPLNPNFARYAERLRDMHDLWHVTCGYGRDVSGEVCLLAFTMAQTRSPGLALIVLAGTLRIARVPGGRGIVSAVAAAFRAGRRAAWLPAADWEQLLACRLEEVRKQLNVSEPTIYPQLLSRLAAA